MPTKYLMECSECGQVITCPSVREKPCPICGGQMFMAAATDGDGECQEPCDPAERRDCCAGYWQRMRDEGLWVDGKGWTDKGWRDIIRHA